MTFAECDPSTKFFKDISEQKRRQNMTGTIIRVLKDFVEKRSSGWKTREKIIG